MECPVPMVTYIVDVLSKFNTNRSLIRSKLYYVYIVYGPVYNVRRSSSPRTKIGAARLSNITSLIESMLCCVGAREPLLNLRLK